MPTPTLVQHASFSSTIQDAPTTYNMRFPNPSLANNCIVVGVDYADTGASISSITDNIGNTYTQAQKVTDATNGNVAEVWTSAGATAGALTVTVTFTGAATSFVQGAISEFYNVATSSAVDVTTGRATSGTTISTAAMTTTADGDLLYNYVMLDASGATGLSWTAGAGWQLESADDQFKAGVGGDNLAVQTQVQATHGSITPSITSSASIGAITIAIALKAAAAGTAAATGIRIVRCLHNNTQDETSGSVVIQAPCDGNLLVLAFIAGSGYSISSISDTAGNTWSQVGSGVSNNSGCQYFYAPNATPSRTLKLTVTMSGSDPTGNGATFNFYDIVGGALSPLDTSATSTGNQTAAGNLSSVSITPSTANGLVLAEVGIAFNTITDLATSPGQFHSGTWGPTETNPNHYDENNGWGGVYNPSTSAIAFTWAQSNNQQNGVGQWAAMAVAFIAAPAPTANDGVIQEPSSGPRGVTQQIARGWI